MASTSTVPDHHVRQHRPVLGWEQLHDVAFNLHRIGVRRPCKSTCKSTEMRIDSDPRNVESIAENHIRRLAPNTGQSHQFLEGSRYRATKVVHNLLRHPDDRRRLVPEEPGGCNERFEFGTVGGRERLRCWILLEECRCHEIHAAISALRGEDCGDSELQWILEIQFAVRVRIGLLQRVVDRAGLRLVTWHGAAGARDP